MSIDLEVGKKYYAEDSECHPTGLKWGVTVFEVLRLDEFPLCALAGDWDDDAQCEVAVVREVQNIDLSMSSFDDWAEPPKIEAEDRLLSLIRREDGDWMGTWWAVSLEVEPFVERTVEDWINKKKECVEEFKKMRPVE